MTVRPRIRHWRTALLSALILGTVYGLIEGFSLFSTAFANELHSGRTAASSVFAVYLLASTLLAPVSGAAVDRFGPRRVVLAAFPVLGVGIAACAAAVSLWQLYLIYGSLIAASATLLISSAQVMVRGGYSDTRGQAVGIAYAGLGIGDFVLFGVLGGVVGHIGWRTGYVVAAGIALAAWLILLPVMHAPARRSAQDATGEARRPPEAAAPAASRTFVYMLAAAFLVGVFDFVVFQHTAPFLVRYGVPESTAGFFLGLAALGYVLGQLGAGFLSDRLARETVGSAAALLAIAGIAALAALVGHPTGLTLGMILLGAGVGGAVGTFSAAVGDLFSGPRLGRISGFMQLSGALGAAVGTALGGVVVDLTGKYTLTFSIAAACAAIWIAVIWTAAPRRARESARPAEATPTAPAR